MLWALKRIAIGDYRSKDDLVIGRWKQRTYFVLHDGFIWEFAGASVVQAQAGLLDFVRNVGLGHEKLM